MLEFIVVVVAIYGLFHVYGTDKQLKVFQENLTHDMEQLNKKMTRRKKWRERKKNDTIFGGGKIGLEFQDEETE